MKDWLKWCWAKRPLVGFDDRNRLTLWIHATSSSTTSLSCLRIQFRLEQPSMDWEHPRWPLDLAFISIKNKMLRPCALTRKDQTGKNLLACVFHSPCPSDAWTSSNDRGALIAAPAIWWTRKGSNLRESDVKLRCRPPCTGLCEDFFSEFRNFKFEVDSEE